MSEFSLDYAFAKELDDSDPLARFRGEFELPPPPQGAPESIYFIGNSLGPLPKRARTLLSNELDRWATDGVRGHFGPTGFANSHLLVTDKIAKMVGALEHEVVAMNALTVNLHLLMVSFYRPTETRNKILIEEHAFPSDDYAVQSQIDWHGYNAQDCRIAIGPDEGEELISDEKIIAAIKQAGDSLAMVMLPGVQYYTGQVFDIPAICEAAHSVGATFGVDLAHGFGNTASQLHDWNVDFASWCSYKYGNSSPGGASGVFVHERHLKDPSLPKLLGWWGNRAATRFDMVETFDSPDTVEAWQLSNPSVLTMTAHRAALEIFEEAGFMAPLIEKQHKMVTYMDFLLDELCAETVTAINPRELNRRGCQHSLRVRSKTKTGPEVFEAIEAAGVFCDWRNPDVIRVAPAPLFNTFSEIRRFVDILAEATS